MRIKGFLFFFALLGSYAQAQTASNFVSITPCRVADTREASRGNLGSPSVAATVQRDLPITESSCSLPANVTAYSINVTVIPHGSLGYLTVWPTGQQQPTASTLNSPSGDVIANGTIVPAGTNGAISVFATNDTDVVIDVNGYFVTVDQSANNQITQLSQQIAQITQQIAQINQQINQSNAQVNQLGQTAAQLVQSLNQLSTQSGANAATSSPISYIIPKVSVSKETNTLVIDVGMRASAIPQSATANALIYVYLNPSDNTIAVNSTTGLQCTFCTYVPGAAGTPAGAPVIAAWQVTNGVLNPTASFLAHTVPVLKSRIYS